MDWLTEFRMAVAGLVIGIAGLMFGFYWWLRPRFRSKLVYETRGVSLIGEHGALPPEATVTYAGRPVQHLTTSLIRIWNHGNATLNRSEIAANDGLRIDFGDDVEILKIEVLKVTRDSIDFSVGDGAGGKLTFAFDFLDSGDGAIIQVLHTGEDIHGRIVGTIKGKKVCSVDFGTFDLTSKRPPPKTWLGKLNRKIGYSAIIRALLLLTALGTLFTGFYPDPFLSYFPSFGEPQEPSLTPGRVSWEAIVGGLVLALVTIAFYNLASRPHPEDLVLEE